VATSQPSSELFPDSTPPLSSGDIIEPSVSPEPTDGEPFDPSTTPTDLPLDGGDGAVGMRVVDRDTTDGLLDTIVGGVAGFFLGG
jgi:hypothetical protein